MVFNRTKADDKLTLSIEDKAFLKIMDEEFFKGDSNSLVDPLPFRTPRRQLPNNKEQALSHLTSLHHTLEKRPEMKKHFVAFMQKILDAQLGSHRFARFSDWKPLIQAAACLICIARSYSHTPGNEASSHSGWHHWKKNPSLWTNSLR